MSDHQLSKLGSRPGARFLATSSPELLGIKTAFSVIDLDGP